MVDLRNLGIGEFILSGPCRLEGLGKKSNPVILKAEKFEHEEAQQITEEGFE